MNGLLVFHIATGAASLLAGGTALVARKGGTVHRRGGLCFVVAMLAMALTGSLLAALNPPNRLSVIAGLVTAYLVLTAWLTVHPRLAAARSVTLALLLAAAGIGFWALTIALTQRTTGGQLTFGMFAGMALLGAGLDLRRLLRGPETGKHRLARHLWRMTLALWLATTSFFLGQADELPPAWRIWPLLALPPVAVLLALGWHLIRTLWRPQRRQPSPPLP